MNRRLQLLQKLPMAVKEIVRSVFSVDTNDEIYKKFDINGLAASDLTTLQTDVIVKSLTMDSLDKEIAKLLKVDAIVAQKIALEIAGKQLLIIDDWFGKAVAKYIKKLGGDTAAFSEFIAKFKKAVAKENEPEIEVEPEVAVEAVEEKESLIFLNMEPTSPDADKRDIKNVFENQVAELLRGNSWQKKMSVNVLTIYYLGIESIFRDELIRVLSSNVEKVGARTVGDWLRLFVAGIEQNGLLDPIKKARFFTNDKSIISLSDEDKKLVAALFGVYENLRNFYEDIKKKPLKDVAIFPYTRPELEKANQEVAVAPPLACLPDRQAGQAPAKKVAPEQPKKVVSKIFSLNNEKDRAAIGAEYDAAGNALAQDKNKILNYFENALAARDNVKILVGLQLLAENKILPAAIHDSVNLKMITEGFIKRHGVKIGGEMAQPMVCFLRGVLEDRIGLDEKEAASFGAWLASNFGKQGLFQFSQLAYFDEEDGFYKWNI
ncbi:MAG: hypothetical protein V1902_00800 [Candidatus Falkowbacteria bacterium]